MIERKRRTLDLYKKVGAEARLFKHILTSFIVDVSCVLYSSDTDRWYKVERLAEALISNAEDQMFKDHPTLGNDYTDVFYGGLSLNPSSNVDIEVMKIMKSFVEDILAKINENLLPFNEKEGGHLNERAPLEK